MKVITNKQWRNLLYGYELTAKEREEFDYIDNEDFDVHPFVRYRGIIYDINEFEITSVRDWDGQHSDSFFSAVLIKLSDDGEQAMMGLVIS